ncbi:MAG: pilus assembly protein PilP [Desulfobacteraceae bacterium]|nr:pilus assembly protein PilP [Desulfobacteraceae bacterium]
MQKLPRKRKSNIFFLVSISILFIFDPAVASQELIYKDPRPLKKVFAVQTGADKAEAEKEMEKGYLYDPTGKTDPFASFIAKREKIEIKQKRKPQTYLETLDLSQLNLSVIIVSPKGKWAMVRDSKGLGHVIKEGTGIGTNGGIVHEIRAGEVIIREEYKDFRGQVQHKDIIKKTPSTK